MQTQWFIGMSGAIGLRYESLYPLLDRTAADRADWDQLFDDVQSLERGALEQMNEDRSE